MPPLFPYPQRAGPRSSISNVSVVAHTTIRGLNDLPLAHAGKASNEQLIKAMEGAGFEARLIGIGNSSVVPSHVWATPSRRPQSFHLHSQIHVPDPADRASQVGPAGENGACVAEFKGEPYGHGSVHGVVRLVQASVHSPRDRQRAPGAERREQLSRSSECVVSQRTLRALASEHSQRRAVYISDV